MLVKVKSKSTQVSKQTTSTTAGGLTPELDVKYHMYECCIKLEDYKQGMAVLEGRMRETQEP